MLLHLYYLITLNMWRYRHFETDTAIVPFQPLRNPIPR